ncbi:MAG TPA: hypothetical protein VFV84_06710, partial [Burkholderiales bacterium]|nr:hypothetical protein [Burkholderiales bacterium]
MTFRPPSSPVLARCRRLLAFLLAALPLAAAAEEAPGHADLDLEIVTAPAKRDFAEMKRVRLVRVLLPHSRTLFYLELGHQRGVSAELVH